jgi:hypothetical protein
VSLCRATEWVRSIAAGMDRATVSCGRDGMAVVSKDSSRTGDDDGDFEIVLDNTAGVVGLICNVRVGEVPGVVLA